MPVPFQDKADPQLFRSTPASQTRQDFQGALANRMGELPLPSVDRLRGLHLDHREEAASLFRSAADQYVAIGDTRAEGGCRNNLGQTLHRLGRWDAARQAIGRAIECGEPFGHVAQPWSTWAILAAIQIGAGDARAAALARANAVTLVSVRLLAAAGSAAFAPPSLEVLDLRPSVP